MDITIRTAKYLKGNIGVPGDKSIAHRAIILNSIAEGVATIENFPSGEDCQSTIDAMRSLGSNIEVDKEHSKVIVRGSGLWGLSKPDETIDVGNSGTTARLLIGLLSGQRFSSEITGDIYLRGRPMTRVVDPVTDMGATVQYMQNDGLLPIRICPSSLYGIDYTMPIASAQVKSAILLATLYSKSDSIIRGDVGSRDHTELMLEAMGVNITTDENYIHMTPPSSLRALDMYIPNDISSAAFFITAGLLIPNSSIRIENVGLNDTRSGIIDIYSSMGADITIENISRVAGELRGDIIAASSNLTSTTISGSLIPRLIDELPIIALAATQATGRTIIKDAQELAVKESNRIESTVAVLLRLGADIEPTHDGMIIQGPTPLYGDTVDSSGDHRIAMMATIAGLVAKGETTIKNSQWIDISFPGYLDSLKKLKTPI